MCSDSADLHFDCEAEICAVLRYHDTTSNEIQNVYYCIHKQGNPHWQEFCDGLRDTENKVYQCCIGENKCSDNLRPSLPSESANSTGIEPYRPSINGTGETSGEDCKLHMPTQLHTDPQTSTHVILIHMYTCNS